MSPSRRKDANGASPGETTSCPWCSATVPATSITCPSCGASLRDAADGDIAGVTQIDPMALARVRRIKPRGRLTSWLTGDSTVDEETGGKVEPPSEAVRREMLRLELAAIDAELEAKAQAAAAQRDLPLDDAAVDATPPKGAPGAKSG